MEAKKIIITGGATRIGAAIAKSLADEATDITIHYNSSSSQAKFKNKIPVNNKVLYFLRVRKNKNFIRYSLKLCFN